MTTFYKLDATQASIVKNMAMTLCGHDVDSRNEDVRYVDWEFHPGSHRATVIELLGMPGAESGLGQALRNLLPAIGAEKN